MSPGKVELRVRDVGTEGLDTSCRGCGRSIHLFFNGGELDGAHCCGFSYTLEAPRYDFVVRRLAATPEGSQHGQ